MLVIFLHSYISVVFAKLVRKKFLHQRESTTDIGLLFCASSSYISTICVFSSIIIIGIESKCTNYVMLGGNSVLFVKCVSRILDWKTKSKVVGEMSMIKCVCSMVWIFYYFLKAILKE